MEEYLAGQHHVTQMKYSSIFPTFVWILSENHMHIAMGYIGPYNLYLLSLCA
jgi:hypothetical protein